MIGIYKITNQINNKVYIGQSRNIKERWKRHRYTAQVPNEKEKEYPLYRAISKYGIDNFTFEVIEECLLEELNEKEIYWISFYNSTNHDFGYNIKEGGNSQPTNAKLNETQLLEIKKRLESGETQFSIAKDYPVDRVVISQINLGKSYIHNDWIYPIHDNTKIKNSKKCLICGKPISHGAKNFCLECFNEKKKNDYSHIPLSREELKDKIRTEQFTKIGEMYNRSGNAVKKWCKKLNLPSTKYEINSYSDEEWEKI